MTELLRIQNLIKKIRDKAEFLSGGSGDKSRYIMREPDLYWKLGEVIEELFEKNNTPEDKRIMYINEKLTSVEEKIWPGHAGLSNKSYKMKYNFIDKERFDTVKMLAGYKFKKFRFKRAEYLISIFSKRKATVTDKQQAEIIKILSEKDLSHDEFLGTISRIRGVSKIPEEKIQEYSWKFPRWDSWKSKNKKKGLAPIGDRRDML